MRRPSVAGFPANTVVPGRNDGSNVSLPRGTELSLTWRFPEREPFRIECPIHPWLTSYALAVDHPFAAVTDGDGRFTIPDLPAGEHTFRVWHERGKRLETRLKVVLKPGPDETTLRLNDPTAKFGM